MRPCQEQILEMRPVAHPVSSDTGRLEAFTRLRLEAGAGSEPLGKDPRRVPAHRLQPADGANSLRVLVVRMLDPSPGSDHYTD